VLQLRAKDLPSGAFLDLCDEVVRLATPFEAAVIVNDRADLARLSGAAGVHVGQDDLPPAAARELLGPDAVIGVSTHTVEQIELARGEPVSYVAVGPVFGSRTKETGYAAVGLDLVSAAARRSGGRPVVAIGGITLDTAPLVMRAGASGVAIISDLLAAPGPSARVRRLVELLSS
jgi:thiamine-phosphate pyrophosphorylase